MWFMTLFVVQRYICTDYYQYIIMIQFDILHDIYAWWSMSICSTLHVKIIPVHVHVSIYTVLHIVIAVHVHRVNSVCV